ncbi:MAG: hypothetical protein DWQ47_06575 [Acidobacteria bacterium]|mgnify:CR=1 FL=1|nr:MAG: hypothetical protein DWQ32_10125 [Acidobacteriota bacterium]REK02038.1 MAG: hypothetical protein DWQ38_06555 [Acidobacteriota bacterium]REK14996.1 MAG: hypothetical protein DWQ43_15815 [Acidobacteriota bacterium]REK45710.1 MAG: hypothetical protein DWQ47_06575 [Acidobacteriota bacterium]
MSNLSDIGFPVKSEEDVNQVLMDVLSGIDQVACPPFGFYYRFEDPSGAQIFLQANPAQELTGFNPGFRSEGLLSLELVRRIERDTSELDGAYVAKGADGSIFVFDLPDFKRVDTGQMPTTVSAELTAFATNDLAIGPVADSNGNANSIKALKDSDRDLLAGNPGAPPPQAHVSIRASIDSAEKRLNTKSKEEFWVFSAKTSAGMVSIVADPVLVADEPAAGDVVEGSFWLSGKIVKKGE